MKLSRNPKYITSLFLAAAMTIPSFAQDTAKKETKPAGGPPDEAAMMAMMMELAKPGENHKLLADTVGSWTYTIKYWANPDPSAAPMESTGATDTKPAMGGRYFISNTGGKMQMPGPDGKMTDMEFKGMSIEGYDNVKKKYVSSWIDNMGTGIVISEGTFDAATKTITYLSEYEPFPGMKTKVRQTVKYSDNDHHTMEFSEQRGGQFVKTMEMAFTRSK